MKRTLNTTINRSKNEKNDEHYTQLSDIEDEVRHYRPQFAGKTVLCNCDDPRSSNFFKYFTRSFEILGLKRVIATCYKSQDVDLFTAQKYENNVEVATFAYTFDAGNRPVTRNNDRFAYNMRDEITSALIGTNNINRAYDTIGNHVFCAFNSATNFYANNQLNQTTASYACVPTTDSGNNDTPPLFDGYDILSTNKFTWSAQGGLQRDGRFGYAFDAEDQLLLATSSHLTNGAIRVVNAYDYRHRRISKTVYRCAVNTVQVPAGSPPSPASTTMWNVKERHDFVYDDWNLIHETVTSIDSNSTTNVAEVEYFWGPDLSNTLQGAGGVGGLLAVSMNGLFYFPVYDNLGNIVKYLDESGTVVAAYDYDDFGRTLSATGSRSEIFAFRFSTKYFDAETELYYFGYRFYVPWLRYWVNRDRIGENGGVNLYEMSRNNLVCCYDKLGCFTIRVHTVWPGHVGIDNADGVTFDYGRYYGRYKPIPLYYVGPNILVKNGDFKEQHSYSRYRFKVCPSLDEKVTRVLDEKFASGRKVLPEKVLNKYLSRPQKYLPPDKRYMGSDWSTGNNCMSFTFSVLASAARKVMDDHDASQKERRQAVALLNLSLGAVLSLDPAGVKTLLDIASEINSWITRE